jgi:hypothetical protein
MVGLQTSTRKHNSTSHSLHQYIDSLLLPCFALSTHFLWSFVFFLVAVIHFRICHSVSLVGGGSIGGRLCTGQGTWEMCFSTKPCASESLNLSEPMFLLFGSDQCMITALSIAATESLLNNFKNHLVPFLHSSKCGMYHLILQIDPNMERIDIARYKGVQNSTISKSDVDTFLGCTTANFGTLPRQRHNSTQCPL